MNKLTHTPWVMTFILRLSVGASLMLGGIAAYRDFVPFLGSVMDSLAGLSTFGLVWAYVLPLLLIVAGVLLIDGRFLWLCAWIGGVALGSIPVGLLLKTAVGGAPLPITMGAAFPFLLWLLVFSFAVQIPPAALPDAEEK